jgi:hypothetical protein
MTREWHINQPYWILKFNNVYFTPENQAIANQGGFIQPGPAVEIQEISYKPQGFKEKLGFWLLEKLLPVKVTGQGTVLIKGKRVRDIQDPSFADTTVLNQTPGIHFFTDKEKAKECAEAVDKLVKSYFKGEQTNEQTSNNKGLQG